MPVKQNEELKHQFGMDLADQKIQVQMRRRTVEQQWLRGHHAWMSLNLERRFIPTDSGNADYHLPLVRRAAERSIVRVVKSLTPNSKWFETSGEEETPDGKLSNADKYMWYVVRKKIKSRTLITQLVRSIVMYGLCHLKTSIKVVNQMVWPSQRAVDVFAFLHYPETVSDLNEAEWMAEDIIMSYERYKTFVRQGIVDDVSPNDLTVPVWEYHMVERLAHQGITNPDVLTSQAAMEARVRNTREQLDGLKIPAVQCTEIWTMKEDAWYQFYVVWNIKNKNGPTVVGCVRSKYDEPTYRSAIHRGIPGESYTNSMMDDIIDLEGLSNDQLNKFQDAIDWEQGHTHVKANQRRESWQKKGRATWEMEDPKEDAVFVSPPNTSNNQLRAWQISMGLINSLAGVGTIAEGQPGRNMPRAGNAVNNLVSLAMADVEDIAQLIQAEILTPGLEDIFKVSEFIPKDQLMRIPGAKSLFGSGKSGILQRDDIMGAFEFEWVGSLQFQDEQLRAQRMMIFLNLMPQLAPMLQQQGYVFNIVELVQAVWRYSLGERSLSKIVMPIDELQTWMQMDQEERKSGKQNGQSGMGGLSYNLPAVTNGFVQQ